MPSPVPIVVFDCNIFLQALLKPNGPAGACKHLVDEGAITLFVSPQVLSEVAEVLARPRIRHLAPALTLSRIEAFFKNITAKAVSITDQLSASLAYAGTSSSALPCPAMCAAEDTRHQPRRATGPQ